MRRLPVYLLLDTSGSMSGEPIESVKNGVQSMASALRQNPQAIETAWISVITFNDSATQLMPLTDLATFQTPDLRASGTTALGAALQLLTQCIEREVTKTTPVKKGDWRPMVFIMTDGVPTDNWQSSLEQFRNCKIAVTVACAAGKDAPTDVLSQITPNVVALDNADGESISRFFAWVSASIGVNSSKIEESGKEASGMKELPPPPPEINLIA